MKLIIDTDEELAEKGHWYTDEELWAVVRAVQDGTPIPDNATNGDVIYLLFPNTSFAMLHRGLIDQIEINKTWWDKLYQKGGKE